MAKKTYRQAINEAIAQEMRRDPRVIVMGEDNAGGMGAPGEDDAWGGVLGVTKGLMPEFGRERVLVHPRPRLSVMAMGGELVDISRTPGNGQVYDVNSYALAAAGHEIVCVLTCSDFDDLFPVMLYAV